MKRSLYITTVLCLILLVGGGCNNAQPNPNVRQDELNVPAVEAPTSTEKKVEEEIDPRIKPVFGGTERDEYGKREQCIVNGDCSDGYTCIEGVCNEPQ